MFHVVLDTNALQSNTLRFTDMMRLKVLIDNYKLKLYIPEIVKREYLTQKTQSLTTKVKAKNISDINNYIHYDSNKVKENLIEANRLIAEVSSIIEKIVEDEFNDWVKDFNIDILPFNESKIHDVLDGYFTGGTVFKSPKNRNDLPDAMIVASIEELQEELDTKVYVINNDKAFSEYLISIGNFTVYDKISNLLEDEDIKTVLIDIEKKLEEFAFISSKIRSVEFATAFIKHLEDCSNYFYIEDDNSFTNIKILGNDIFALSVELDNPSDALTIKVSDGLAISDNEAYFTLSYSIQGSLNYITNYIEYKEIEESRKVEYNKMNRTNGDVSLTEERTLILSTTITLPIKDISKKVITEIFDFCEIEINEDMVTILPLQHV